MPSGSKPISAFADGIPAAADDYFVFESAAGVTLRVGFPVLQALIGAGAPGEDGRDGITIPAFDGEDGEDGISIPGPRGSAGLNGINGVDGKTVFILPEEPEPPEEPLIVRGPQGIQGIQGNPGAPGSGGGSIAFPVIDDLLDAFVGEEPVPVPPGDPYYTYETKQAVASASDIAINVISPGALIFSKAVNLRPGQTVEVEAELALLNNSGAAQTYTFSIVVGGFTQNIALGATIAASATNRTPGRVKATISVVATNSLRVYIETAFGTPAAVGTAGNAILAHYRNIYNTSGTNVTGNVAVEFRIISTATATQTCNLVAGRVKVYQNI